jgi:copper(I)-binding protein
MSRRPASLGRLAFLIPLILSSLLVELSACRAGGTAAGSEQVRAAAGTATALIQDAQSTVIVLKAQAMATALVETLNAPPPGVTSVEIHSTPSATPPKASQTTPGRVEITAVTTAAEGAYIMVEFRAPVRLVESWYQGRVSVTDESSGAVYAEIPTVGTIGLLIGRPRVDGQLGYVMLVNAPAPLASGAQVTVVLGDFKQEHLIIQ